MKLIDDCRGAWRHYSTQALAIIASAGVTWANLPDWFKSSLPPWMDQAVAALMTAGALLGLLGKFIDQSPQAKS